MPLYYFDTVNGEVLSSDDEFDLEDLEAAKSEALRYLAEASIDHLSHTTPMRCTVKDQDKKFLFRMRLVLEIEP